MSNIQLHITKTARTYKEKEYHCYDSETKYFADLNEAKKWIKEQYGKHHRTSMYRDTDKDKTQRIGYVIRFRNTEYDRDLGKTVKFLEEHWIEFRVIGVLDLDEVKA